MSLPRVFETAYLFQGTVTEGVVITLHVYKVNNLVIGRGPGDILEARSSIRCLDVTIFTYELAKRSLSDDEIKEMVVGKPVGIFYKLVQNRGEVEGILTKLHTSQGFPAAVALRMVDAHMELLPR